MAALERALERALASERSTLLELRTAAEAISPSETISSIRAGHEGEPAAGWAGCPATWLSGLSGYTAERPFRRPA
jgi:hypothetical protein